MANQAQKELVDVVANGRQLPDAFWRMHEEAIQMVDLLGSDLGIPEVSALVAVSRELELRERGAEVGADIGDLKVEDLV